MHLIACEVFRPELERLTRAMRNAPEVTYLEQGLHDTPDELRRRVQQAVDALEAKGETIIFLAYGLCGRGLTGVTGHTATLILPRVHDCIPVLLGATQEQANESSLGGGKDGRFMRIAPGFTPDLDGNGTITAVRVTS